MGQKGRLRTRRFPHRTPPLQLPIPAPTIGSRWPRSYWPQLHNPGPIGARSAGPISQGGVTEAEMVAGGEAGEAGEAGKDVNSRGARVSTAQASKRTRACPAQGGR